MDAILVRIGHFGDWSIWKDNIKVFIKEIQYILTPGVDLFGSWWRQVAVSFGQGDTVNFQVTYRMIELFD